MYQLLTKRLAISKIRLSLALAIKLAVTLVLFSSFIGCGQPQPKPAKKDTGIINKVTQDITEAKPGQEQADMQAKGMTAVPGAYGYAVAETSRLTVKHAVDLYQAETGEYPKDFDEFMEKVIKRGGIKLPVLPGGRQYQYDVDKHKLIVVEKAEKEKTE